MRPGTPLPATSAPGLGPPLRNLHQDGPRPGVVKTLPSGTHRTEWVGRDTDPITSPCHVPCTLIYTAGRGLARSLTLAHAHDHAPTRTRTRTYTRVRTHTHSHTCARAHAQTHTLTHKRACVRAHAHTHTCARTHARSRTRSQNAHTRARTLCFALRQVEIGDEITAINGHCILGAPHPLRCSTCHARPRRTLLGPVALRRDRPARASL